MRRIAGDRAAALDAARGVQHTASLDALKAYSAAYRAIGTPTAIPLLKRAVEIDPGFAIAHSLLGLAYSTSGETVLGEESTRKAYELRDHATDRDRFFIMTIYDRQVTGNLEKEGETLRLWAQTYPRDPVAPGLTSGFFAAGTGQYRVDGREGPGSDCPRSRRGAGHSGVLQRGLGLYQPRSAGGRRAGAPAGYRARGINRTRLTDAYHIAFLKDDAPGMQRQVALGQGQAGPRRPAVQPRRR